jgi:DNA-binding transcriptional MocR family regulator
LDALAASGDDWRTTAELADTTGRSLRQVRTACDALERRGLVAVTRGYIGWSGTGEYGQPKQRREFDFETRKWRREPGEPIGMPRYGRQIWLPDRKLQAR